VNRWLAGPLAALLVAAVAFQGCVPRRQAPRRGEAARRGGVPTIQRHSRPHRDAKLVEPSLFPSSSQSLAVSIAETAALRPLADVFDRGASAEKQINMRYVK